MYIQFEDKMDLNMKNNFIAKDFNAVSSQTVTKSEL